MGCYVTAVAVVSATDDNNNKKKLIGVTATTFSSVSLALPFVLWALSKYSQKHSIMTRVKNYAINILKNQQEDSALNFPKNQEPFLNLNHYFNKVGVLIIMGSPATVECRLHAVYDSGDYSIILGMVTLCKRSNLKPLTFFRGKFN